MQSRRVDSHLLLHGTSKARKSRDRETGRDQARGQVEGRRGEIIHLGQETEPRVRVMTSPSSQEVSSLRNTGIFRFQ